PLQRRVRYDPALQGEEHDKSFCAEVNPVAVRRDLGQSPQSLSWRITRPGGAWGFQRPAAPSRYAQETRGWRVPWRPGGGRLPLAGGLERSCGARLERG